MNGVGKISLCMAVGDLLSNGKSQPTIQLAQMVQSRYNLDMKFVSKRELQTRFGKISVKNQTIPYSQNRLLFLLVHDLKDIRSSLFKDRNQLLDRCVPLRQG